MGFVAPVMSSIGSGISSFASSAASTVGSIFSGVSSLAGGGSDFVGPPTQTQSVFSKIGNVVSAVAPIASTVFQAKTSMDARMDEYEATLAADSEYNKLAIQADAKAREQAKIEADALLMDAMRAAQEERELARKAAATQKVGYLKSGVLLEGSPLLVIEETYRKGKENAQNILSAANRQAKAIEAAADIDTPLLRRASLASVKTGNTSDLISGGSKLLDIYRQIK